ncbi:MAG: MBL fold metallo-hydrolase [Thermoanaerobaculia bacterium]|nr:MBL fold metallo-hydrolase [Thermoanaerobaculia bacterium]
MRSPRTTVVLSLTLAVAVLTAPTLLRAQGTDFDAVEIEVTTLADGVHMLVGAGGNVGISTGGDGAVLIDDQFAPLTERILAAVAELGGATPRFVLNTHWHFDHTGGNENLGRAGVVILAHENVRRRMSVEQVMEAFGRTIPASPPVALPSLTFTESTTLHWNGQTLRAFHVPAAHTDGDTIVHFVEADVVHMGDVFFNRSYPFIDVGSGGSLDGVIAAVERALELCGEATRIIPGHGPLADRADLERYLEMLRTVRRRVAEKVEMGWSREKILASDATADLDADWGGSGPRRDLLVNVALDAAGAASDVSE